MAKDPKEVRKIIGENIRKIREDKNLTQEEVAETAGMKANYFAKIERGTVGTAPEKIFSIIKALKVEASEIFPS
jgi:transcriptional regulator with XRE-family HTH domain